MFCPYETSLDPVARLFKELLGKIVHSRLLQSCCPISKRKVSQDLLSVLRECDSRDIVL